MTFYRHRRWRTEHNAGRAILPTPLGCRTALVPCRSGRLVITAPDLCNPGARSQTTRSPSVQVTARHYPGLDETASNSMIEGSLRRVRVVLATIFAVAVVVRHAMGASALGFDLTLTLALVAAMIVATNVVAIVEERRDSRRRQPHGLVVAGGDLVLALAVMVVFDSQATPLAWVALTLPILSVSIRYGLGAAAIVWLAASSFVIAFRIQTGEPGSEGDALVLGFQQLGAVLLLAVPASYLIRHMRREISLTDSERERAQRRAEGLREVADVARLISEASTPRDVIAMTADGALRLGFAAVDVCERSSTTGWRLVSSAGMARRPAATEILSEDGADGEMSSLTPADGHSAVQLLHHLGFAAGHGLLVAGDGDITVVLRVWSTPDHTTIESDLAALELLVKQARAAWRNSRLFEMLSLQATRDTLTGLANRASFFDELEDRLNRPLAALENLAVLFVDLDGFKEINDEMGHHVGDEVLIHTAQRFRGVAPADALLARFGGDEFVMLSPRFDSPDDALDLARKMCEALSEPIALNGGARATVRASVGLAFAESGVPPQNLLRRADGAMYEAKRLGGSRFVVWRDVEQRTRIEPTGELR